MLICCVLYGSWKKLSFYTLLVTFWVFQSIHSIHTCTDNWNFVHVWAMISVPQAILFHKSEKTISRGFLTHMWCNCTCISPYMCMFVDSWGILMEYNQHTVIFQGRGLVLCAIKCDSAKYCYNQLLNYICHFHFKLQEPEFKVIWILYQLKFQNNRIIGDVTMKKNNRLTVTLEHNNAPWLSSL